MALVDRTERAQHWFTTGWPVVTTIVSIAVLAGIAWAGLGRISILEVDLQQRSDLLPAKVTGARIDRMEVSANTAAQKLSALEATVTALRTSVASHEDHDFQRDLRAGAK